MVKYTNNFNLKKKFIVNTALQLSLEKEFFFFGQLKEYHKSANFSNNKKKLK